jgi:PIN domain nuclease of toxin-antitoxin system
MPLAHVVDAHALIWYLSNDSSLGQTAMSVLDDPESVLILPTIAWAEICWTVAKGRTNVASLSDLYREVGSDPRITFEPLDREIVELAQTLDRIGEMHDRQIAACALRRIMRGEQAALITRDPNIIAANVVPIVW